MMGELKQIKILNINFLMVASFKKFRKALVGAPIRFKITETGLKMRKIWG
jgi:hypothetical protein